MLKSLHIRNFATAISKSEPKSNVRSKARAIKNLNYENKALFGAVLKDSSADTVANPVITSNDQPAYASEIFWLLENKNAPVKGLRATGSKPKISQQIALPDVPIPFSNTELRSIPTFPLIPTSTGILERTWSRHERYENGQCKSPSVNKILNVTMPDAARQALLKWKASKIGLLGEEGFAELQKETLERGSNFHACLESWLNGEPICPDRLEKADALWNSINHSLNKVERPARVIERKIYHPFLHYNGVVDCVSSIGNKFHIIEWKTSENQKPYLSSTYDAPIQLCAYLGALKAEPEYATLDITNGAVFVAYTNGSPAHVHLINHTKLKKYWTVWVKRLQEYWIRYRDGTLPEPV